MKNTDVRIEVIRAGIKLKDLAKELGILPSNLTRKLKKTLTPAEKQHYISLIREMKECLKNNKEE